MCWWDGDVGMKARRISKSFLSTTFSPQLIVSWRDHIDSTLHNLTLTLSMTICNAVSKELVHREVTAIQVREMLEGEYHSLSILSALDAHYMPLRNRTGHAYDDEWQQRTRSNLGKSTPSASSALIAETQIPRLRKYQDLSTRFPFNWRPSCDDIDVWDLLLFFARKFSLLENCCQTYFRLKFNHLTCKVRVPFPCVYANRRHLFQLIEFVLLQVGK